MTTTTDTGLEPLLLPPRLRTLDVGDVSRVACKLWSAQRTLRTAA